jgi:four helix bundle protein
MNDQNTPAPKRPYDLEERTAAFGERVREFARMLPRGSNSKNDTEQLVRSSGSVGANYIEANESLGKADFIMRVRISLKESKESRLWLRLLYIPEERADLREERRYLYDEADQFVRIFSTILKRSGASRKKQD